MACHARMCMLHALPVVMRTIRHLSNECVRSVEHPEWQVQDLT